MTESMIQCSFHHVPTELGRNIDRLIGIRCEVKEKEGVASCFCALIKAEEIRSTIADTFGEFPQLWLSISYPLQPKTSSYRVENSIGKIDCIRFGALLSVSKFIVHDTRLDEKSCWSAKVVKKTSIVFKCSDSTISLTLHNDGLRKTVLIIDGSDYADLILGFDQLTISTHSSGNIKGKTLNGNDPVVQSLTACSEMLISMSSKSEANMFVDYLRRELRFQVYYTLLSMEKNKYSWANECFQQYPSSDARYGLAMLHSLGYLFDDKYLYNKALQKQMIAFAYENPQCFYQLAMHSRKELKEKHWFDLTNIFNSEQWKLTLKGKSQNPNKSIYVGMVHITPTRLSILPKEKNQGHRAMRRTPNESPGDYCLVDLKPDPPNKYLNDDPDLMRYLHAVFRTGIDIGGTSYHFFGLSNSQLKNHSFWFRKAASLNDIHRLRNDLGQLGQIRNLGTYVARLGLWFSKTDPTGIKLNFCMNEREFYRRVAQHEHCVMMIDDIERNNYCFTDGNGLVSKGLAKLIAENLSLVPKGCSEENILPCAYQIRLAGCKGMIIIDPASTYDQFYIKIRPSMKKFDCDDWTLEVCNHSEPKTSRLNNQIIWLLSDLGVPDETFFRLQQRWFASKPSRTHLAEALEKNQIPLPANECRFIYGCALGSSLQEGQCFIRYQVLSEQGKPLTKPKFDCVRGRVIVTKNPCPYAGDMLELWAVDLPELHDLHDVIVFSTCGERPDFNKIAGSDLDGDGYFIYWGDELRLKRPVEPLDYTPDQKKVHRGPITPDDVIDYCLSTIGATSYGEIYNIHATVVDQNFEKHPQRTCQKLAIELAKMFSSAVDSGKTGYIVDRQRIKEIRAKYAEKYPDFLRKPYWQSYKSKSIVGKLYHNALKYRDGKDNELEAMFAQMNLKDNEEELSNQSSLSSTSSIGQPMASSTPLNQSVQLHPGSPLSTNTNSTLLSKIDSSTISQKIPSQFVLVDGMNTVSPLIRLSRSDKPIYSRHQHLNQLRLELMPTDTPNAFVPSASLASILFEQIPKTKIPTHQRTTTVLSVAFGSFYLLKYPSQYANDQYPSVKEVIALIKDHFLPPLSDTFLPSTILECIEITQDNAHRLQQIFYKANHWIRNEYIESKDDQIQLLFPWLKMNLIEHRREILLLCWDRRTNSEICVHFDKNGRIQHIETSPKIVFKCFHQQNSLYRPDLLYELRSSSIENDQYRSRIFKHETLLDPTHPLTLPLQPNIVPILSYSRVANVFEFEQFQVHTIRNYSPIHFKDEDYYRLQCTMGYFDEPEQENSVEIYRLIDEKHPLDQKALRSMMSLASELSQMLK